MTCPPTPPTPTLILIRSSILVPMAVVTSEDKLGRDLGSHTSGGQKSKIGFIEIKSKCQQVCTPIGASKGEAGLCLF